MLSEQISPTIMSYWCPHMETPGRVDIAKHIAWQELNDLPDFLCKYKKVTAV